MGNKQEAAEECRIQKHSIILDNRKLKKQGIWRAIKMLEKKRCDGNCNTDGYVRGQRIPAFSGNEGFLLRVVLPLLVPPFPSLSFFLPFLAFPCSSSLHPSPISQLLFFQFPSLRNTYTLGNESENFVTVE